MRKDELEKKLREYPIKAIAILFMYIIILTILKVNNKNIYIGAYLIVSGIYGIFLSYKNAKE
jgi:hypothetical protein